MDGEAREDVQANRRWPDQLSEICVPVPDTEDLLCKPSDQMNEQLLKRRDAVKTVSVIDTLVLER